MSVDEAIEHYGIISREVFSHPNLMPIGGGSKFSAARLEKAIKKVVREKTGKADELLINTQSEGQSEGRVCKTYVQGVPFSSLDAYQHQLCVCHGRIEYEGGDPPSLPHLRSPRA
jgi:hypothetical protein